MIYFELDWQALGPFSIGTREDPWRESIDPLKVHPSSCTYASTLCNGAKWKVLEMDLLALEDISSSIALELSYDDEVDWKSLVQVYGWAATQFDAWIRGYFQTDTDCIIRLNVRHSPEFFLDGSRYEGDIYDLGVPILLPVSKGRHRLDIRVVNEIRIFGFKQNPVAVIRVDAEMVKQQEVIYVKVDKLPDIIRYNGKTKPASKFFSLQIDCLSREDVLIHAVSAPDGRLMGKLPIVLAACQSRRITLQMDDFENMSEVEVHYETAGQRGTARVDPRFSLSIVDADCPHIFTYLNSDGSLGRAVLRPPRDGSANSAPVMLALHGAGVEIANPAWKDVFAQSYLSAWIVQPDCGRWGDDWHELASLSIDSCLQSLVQWARMHSWQGASADILKILIMGHSVSPSTNP